MPVSYYLYVVAENAFPLLFSVFNTKKDGHINFLKHKIDISQSFWKLRETYCDKLLRRIPFFQKAIVQLPYDLKMLVRPCYGEASIAHEIFASSAYERFASLRKGNVVVDVGSNIGLFTLKASSVVGPTGRVIAIEPNQDNYHVLRYNVELNKLDNIRTFRCALGDEVGYVDLYLSSFGSGTHSIVFKMSDRTEKVLMTTLDSLIATRSTTEEYDHIEFIKIDAEGSECKILRGASRTLKHYHPKLAIESTKETLRAECIRLLKKLDYEVCILDDYVYGF